MGVLVEMMKDSEVNSATHYQGDGSLRALGKLKCAPVLNWLQGGSTC